jgi:hypothetical protein
MNIFGKYRYRYRSKEETCFILCIWKEYFPDLFHGEEELNTTEFTAERQGRGATGMEPEKFPEKFL